MPRSTSAATTRCGVPSGAPHQVSILHLTWATAARAELMLLGRIHGIVQGLRYMGYVGTQDNLVRR